MRHVSRFYDINMARLLPGRRCETSLILPGFSRSDEQNKEYGNQRDNAKNSVFF